MRQQVGGVAIHAIGARALQLFLDHILRTLNPLPRHGRGGRQAYPTRCHPQQLRFDGHVEPFRCGHKQIGVGFGVLDLVARHDGNALGDSQGLECGWAVAKRPLVAMAQGTWVGSGSQKLARAGKRPDWRRNSAVGLGMELLQVRGLFARGIEPGFAQPERSRTGRRSCRCADECATRRDGCRFLQRLAPGQHMLVNAIHQRAIEIEEKGGRDVFHGCRIMANHRGVVDC